MVTRFDLVLCLLVLAAGEPSKGSKDADDISSPEERIATGEFYRADVPFLASVQYLSREHVCGATILNVRWLLTAAHCFEKGYTTDYSVVVGTRDLSDRRGSYKIYRIDQIFIHGLYRKNRPGHDICLVRVSDNLKKSKRVQQMALNPSQIGAGIQGQVAIWGAEYAGGPLTTNLKYLSGSTVGNIECKRWIHNVTEDALCVVYPSQEELHLGDSGGPLLYNNMQIGIVLWKHNGSGLFTRVSPYIGWIKEILKTYVGY